jgi:flagellar basal-body rod modification protein FlgD
MSAGAISGAAGGALSSVAGAFGDLTSEDFIKVMISEMANQDPFDPQDSQALLEQLSSLRNIESQLALQDQIGALVLQNQVASAGGLIGKLVAGRDDANDAVSGLVQSVRVAEGKVVLELDTGRSLSMDRVTNIAELSG